MAKHGKRRGRVRSQAARLARDFTQRSRKRYVDEALTEEQAKQKCSEYSKHIAEKEKDLLSKTIFIKHVRDANVPANLKILREFFERMYGPVVDCRATYFQGRNKQRNLRFPPARIQFQSASSAEKIFGGTALLQVRKAVEIQCPVGCKRPGQIAVSPCRIYPDMMKHQLAGSVIRIECCGFSLGHWFRDLDEMLPLEKDDKHRIDGEWVQVFDCSSVPSVEIDLNKRRIDLKLNEQFISFRFKHLESPINLCYDKKSDELALVFRLKHPPNIERFDVTWGDRKSALDWNGIEINEFGRCLGYKLFVSPSQVNDILFHDNCTKLKSFGVIGFSALDRSGNISCSRESPDEREALDEEITRLGRPRVQLLLQSLLGRGKFCAFHVVAVDDLKFLTALDKCPTLRAVEVLTTILHTRGTTRHMGRLFERLRAAPASKPSSLSTHSYCVSIPRLLLTPSRSLVTSFELEISNRVIRKFMEDEGFCAEAFLRVQIANENGMNFFSGDFNEELESSIMQRMRCGIGIYGRRYEFLGYSTSQLKECSVWMVCPENGWSIESMRKSLGDFNRCKTASKYAARLGQCFSSTVQGLAGADASTFGNESFLRHKEIDDVWGDRERTKCHSDGTGLIRREALNKLLSRLPFSRPADPLDVSLIQIRFGGAKGTLTAWDFDKLSKFNNLNNYDVCLRPSMIKFDAKYSHLEVCSIGTRVPYFLNRNMIMLLRSHNVTAETFLSMQREMLDALDKMVTNTAIAKLMLPKL